MKKFELWGLISGSVRPNISPGLECLQHWRNAGSLSWPDLVMLNTMLEGETWRGDVVSREREGSENFPGSKSLLPQIYLQ